MLPLVLGSELTQQGFGVASFFPSFIFVGCLGTAASQTAVLRTFSEIKACVGREELSLAFFKKKKKILFFKAKP